MTGNVTYNETGEPTSIRLSEQSFDVGCHFSMEGSTAVLTTAEPRRGENVVYADDLQRAMGYVESLPFVQAVTLDEYTEDTND